MNGGVFVSVCLCVWLPHSQHATHKHTQKHTHKHIQRHSCILVFFSLVVLFVYLHICFAVVLTYPPVLNYLSARLLLIINIYIKSSELLHTTVYWIVSIHCDRIGVVC